jgi:hypothetical protein
MKYAVCTIPCMVGVWLIEMQTNPSSTIEKVLTFTAKTSFIGKKDPAVTGPK